MEYQFILNLSDKSKEYIYMPKKAKKKKSKSLKF